LAIGGDVSPRVIAGLPVPPSPLSNTIDPMTLMQFVKVGYEGQQSL
jgi:hypothetical protein